ncbi:MAG: uroporphyrinogen-III synthase [Saprospiraceae bacterium]|nr:uroporphyrinogen-III synthase [Saprospiraceae bacterium]MBP7679602.1 uroporphyrinogen-III synthase [Saprospiraceae bacterium]
MAVKSMAETYRKVSTILVSQPKPPAGTKSPYADLEKKYDLAVDFRPFMQIEPVLAKDFRKYRIRPDEFPCVIFTSKNAVDHFFRLCEEMRVKMSPETKYFCPTESIGNYLQKFIVFRKRKVFTGEKSLQDITNAFKKHNKENFLLPCNNHGVKALSDFLNELGIAFQEAIMYLTVNADLEDLRHVKYDVLTFFSTLEIQSLFDNFPEFKQDNTRIAVFGAATEKAAQERGLQVDIVAPTPETPSIQMALDKYLQLSNKTA